MNRRRFFKIAAAVLAGACGADWLWRWKPKESNWKNWKNWTHQYTTISHTDFMYKAPELLKNMQFLKPYPRPQQVTYSPCKEDPVCKVLQRHFSLRVWRPYAVRVWQDRIGFVVNIGDGDWDRGAIYRFCLHPDEVGPGCVNRMDLRFDDAFKRLREIVANGSLMTGAQV